MTMFVHTHHVMVIERLVCSEYDICIFSFCILCSVIIVLLTCCCVLIATQPHQLQVLHSKMDLFGNTTSGDLPTDGESGGNRSINGTNLAMAVTQPCVYCFVLSTFYLVALVFTVVVLALVVTAKALPHVIRLLLVNILTANFTGGFGVLLIVLSRGIMNSVQHFTLSSIGCRFLIVFIAVGGNSRP